eukprot:SAG11_NODE_2388_length_3416_cov_2.842327_4_plen_395_part_01
MRGGRDTSENPKLAFLLKRAAAMEIGSAAIEVAYGAPLPGPPKSAAAVSSTAVAACVGGGVGGRSVVGDEMDVMGAIKAAVEHGGADPEENMRLGFALDQARKSGMPEAMIQRVLSMVVASASAAAASAAAAAAPAAAPACDAEDEEPELTAEDLAAMKEDVLDSIRDSVMRGGRDTSENPKLAFLLKRAAAMEIGSAAIEAACAQALVTPVTTVPATASPCPELGSTNSSIVVEDQITQPQVRPVAEVLFEGVRPPSSVAELEKMDAYQHDTMIRLRSSFNKLIEFNDLSQQQFAEMQPVFAVRSKQLKEMKIDLDASFGTSYCASFTNLATRSPLKSLIAALLGTNMIAARIRKIKAELAARFPNALARAEAETQAEFTALLKQKAAGTPPR